MTRDELFADITQIARVTKNARKANGTALSIEDAYFAVLVIHYDWFAAHPFEVSEAEILKQIEAA